MPLKLTSWVSLYYRQRANFDGLQSDHYPESLNEHDHFPTTSSQVKYEQGWTVTDIKSEGGKVVIEHESTADAKDKIGIRRFSDFRRSIKLENKANLPARSKCNVRGICVVARSGTGRISIRRPS